MRFFSTATLAGSSRSKTPEGFLICENVRVARAGELVYQSSEFDVPPSVFGFRPGSDGIVTVRRDDADLLRPETLASFEGKPLLGEHIETTPENWRDVAWGHMQNVRAGNGADAGYMLADLVVCSSAGIDAIEAGREEVSLFYDFDFVPDGVGRGRQTNIIGNHVAVVDAGRCGPSCRIGDHQPRPNMVTRMSKAPWWVRAMGHALKAGDEDTAVEIAAAEKEEKPGAGDEDGESGTESRLKRLEDGMALIMKKLDEQAKKPDEPATQAEDSDEEYEKMKAGDSGRAAIRAEWQSVMSGMEILAPGCAVRLPAFDSAGFTKVKALRDSMGRCRLAAMDHAMATDEGRAILSPLLQGRAVSAVPPSEQGVIFSAAVELARQRNNQRVQTGDSSAMFAVPSTGALYQSLYGARH